jgi:hypothetical protein
MFGYYKMVKGIKNFLVKSDFYNKISKKNDTVYIFGNGYSIADLNLGDFRGEDCFVCNEFFRMKGFSEFIENNNISYFAIDGMNSFIREAQIRRITTNEMLVKFVDPIISEKYPIIVQSSMVGYISKKKSKDSIGVMGGDLASIMKKKYTITKIHNNVTRMACTVRHTPHAMIAVALILGYKRILLYGLDHTYVRDILNKNPMAGKHFYLETQMEVLNSNLVFTSNQCKIKLSNLFIDSAETFKVYEAQREIADLLNIQIIDKSNGSLFCFQDFNLFDLALMENSHQKLS